MERKWWKESVVYQIYPRSFCDSNGDGIGDLPGIISKLDYIKELGVDVVWISPIYDSPNDDNGYDIRDYRAIMREFGTMEDFDRLLSAMHERGLKLVMDLVVNHSSDEHAWFVESRSSKDNPYRDYYIWKDPVDGHAPNNWGSCFSGPAWEYDETTGQYYLHLFSKKQPDLNWENPIVRDEVFDMMRWWLDKGVDGFRMDVISLISKDPEYRDGEPQANGYGDFNHNANWPKTHEYLREMRRRVLDDYDTLTVGECSGGTLESAMEYARLDGSELNMIFHFEHMALDGGDGVKWSDRRMDLRDLKAVMSKWQTGLQGKAWNSLYWDNHDQPRIVSRLGNDSDAWREISAKMLATCLHMMQGTPYIYQGEELAMTNVPFAGIEDYRDLDSINAYYELTAQGKFTAEEMLRFMASKSRDNARTPMQWDDTVNAGFTTGTPWIMVNPNYTKINAAEQVSRPDSVFAYYQKLIALRREELIVVYGDYQLLLPEDPHVYAYLRHLNNETLLVICNFSAESRTVSWNQEVNLTLPEHPECLIANYEENIFGADITMQPYGTVVWKW